MLKSCVALEKRIDDGISPQSALAATLEQYIHDANPSLDPNLIKDIKNFVFELKTTLSSGNLQPNHYIGERDEELKEILRVGIIEMAKTRTVSSLVDDIDNILAANPSNLKITLEQTVRLEKALNANEVKPHNILEAKEKLNFLLVHLYKIFGQTILKSQSENALDLLIETQLPEPDESCPRSFYAYNEIQAQHEFLAHQKFYQSFYQDADKEKQLIFCCAKSRELKESGRRTPELRVTLISLYEDIVATCYQPVNHRMFKLGGDREATVDYVFEKVKLYASHQWKDYNDQLRDELDQKLHTDEKNYHEWARIRSLTIPSGLDAKVVDPRPFFQTAHCYRYTTPDPEACPFDYADYLALPRSPKKNPLSAHASNTATHLVPKSGQGDPLPIPLLAAFDDSKENGASLSLLATDEKLDDSDAEPGEDHEHKSKPNKRSRII